MPDSFSLWQILVLAIIQGITEFLPISSSGHLLLLAPWLRGGQEPPNDMLTVSVALHVGTLGSIVVHYQAAIRRLLTADRQVLGLILLGTAPAVLAGLIVKIYFENLVETPWLAGCMLLVTGGLLWAVQHKNSGTVDYQRLSWRGALGIGICQAAAILPGLSRSGATIAAGLMAGLSRPAAATYSFLLALPALAGAGLLEAIAALREQPQVSFASLFFGAVVSFAVGLGALSWLERWLLRGRLVWFAWYCLAIGSLSLLWQLG